MSKPPPADLKDWSKNMLRREVERLRALMREHSDRAGDDPREHATTGALIGDGDPHAAGNVIVDTRSAVLLEHTSVALIDNKNTKGVFMMLTLAGRVNTSHDHVEHAYMFGPDGAAGITTELIGLAHRAGNHGNDQAKAFYQEFVSDFKQRMERMP